MLARDYLRSEAAQAVGNVLITGDFLGSGNIGRDNPGGTIAGLGNYLKVNGTSAGTLLPDNSIFEKTY